MILKCWAHGHLFRAPKAYAFAFDTFTLEEELLKDDLVVFWEILGYEEGVGPSDVPTT